MNRYLSTGLVLGMLVLALVPGRTSVEAAPVGSDLSGYSVAVFSDGLAAQHNQSELALVNMFTWMNASVELVTGEDIRNGCLDEYDILAMPATSPYTFFVKMGGDGVDAFREFVMNGGSFFGVLGGNYFEWDAYFDYNDCFLIDGRLNSPTEEYGYNQLVVEIDVNHDCAGPDLSEQPEKLNVTYWESGYFSGFEDDAGSVVATYSENGLPAMVAYELWNGSVFMTSVFPEFEENSDRDGASLFDHLDDSDSEWGLMLDVSKWLIESSVYTTSSGSGSIHPAIIAGASIAVVAVAAFGLTRRR